MVDAVFSHRRGGILEAHGCAKVYGGTVRRDVLAIRLGTRRSRNALAT